MTSTLKYKGYTGTIEIDTDAERLCGRVLFIRGLIVYEADTLPELRRNFESAIDDYLASCASDGTTPEKSASGTFNVRIGPELHAEAVIAAHHAGISLNEWMKRSVQAQLLSEGETQSLAETKTRRTTDTADKV